MTDRVVLVYVELGGTPQPVGRLWSRVRKGRESATFEYDAAWLRHPDRFALEPGLALGPGPHHTGEGRAIFGALGDSAPDRWGRNLISRAERKRARAEGRVPRTVHEIDYLLGVNDETRLGALRFKLSADGPFLAEGSAGNVPPLLRLGELLQASAHVEDDEDSDADLRLLLAPGSSLGGARPKASVRGPQGELMIAKFPSQNDDYDVVRWEAVALGLAHRAGIPVPWWRVEPVGDRHVLLVRRFDREGDRRIPFLSAMSLTESTDGQTQSYMDIADALRQHGAVVATDLPQLWRRVVFNVLISNLDDHMRNHAVLYSGSDGWRLSPAYDLNPVPVDVRPRVLAMSISIDGDTSASLDLALSVAREFNVLAKEAREVVEEVGAVVAMWRKAAGKIGLDKSAQDRMASAFEHEDLRKAVGG
ncbi:MAG: type II toxin-antitoxin system HipA family toxin [Gemmatimonadetes bacterium]|nr:type II toxin-antitoxin system HipA family toxin [Gemmatimonadota bacterium]